MSQSWGALTCSASTMTNWRSISSGLMLPLWFLVRMVEEPDQEQARDDHRRDRADQAPLHDEVLTPVGEEHGEPDGHERAEPEG